MDASAELTTSLSMMYNCLIKQYLWIGLVVIYYTCGSLMVGMSLYIQDAHACDMKVIRKTNATEYDAYQVLFFMSHFF